MAMGLILFVTFLVIFFSFVFLMMTNDIKDIKDTLTGKKNYYYPEEINKHL